MHFFKSSSIKLAKAFTRFRIHRCTFNSSPKNLTQDLKRNFTSWFFKKYQKYSKHSFDRKFIVNHFIIPFGVVAGFTYLSFYIADEIRKNRKRPLRGLARDLRMFQE